MLWAYLQQFMKANNTFVGIELYLKWGNIEQKFNITPFYYIDFQFNIILFEINLNNNTLLFVFNLNKHNFVPLELHTNANKNILC